MENSFNFLYLFTDFQILYTIRNWEDLDAVVYSTSFISTFTLGIIDILHIVIKDGKVIVKKVPLTVNTHMRFHMKTFIEFYVKFF